jgi:hypothetical protein
VTLAPDRVQAPQAAAEFGVAVLGSAWHAVDLTQPLITGPVKFRWFSACGLLVNPTERWKTFGDLRATNLSGVCARCLWTVAIRTGTTREELDRIDAAVAPAPPHVRVVLDLARIILAIADPSDLDEQADPRVVELLAAVSGHVPVAVVEAECSDGDCGHDAEARERPGCPITGWACPTCSLRLGPWAGERADHFEPAGIVPPPCSVLGALRRVLPDLRPAQRCSRSR